MILRLDPTLRRALCPVAVSYFDLPAMNACDSDVALKSADVRLQDPV